MLVEEMKWGLELSVPVTSLRGKKAQGGEVEVGPSGASETGKMTSSSGVFLPRSGLSVDVQGRQT